MTSEFRFFRFPLLPVNRFCSNSETPRLETILTTVRGYPNRSLLEHRLRLVAFQDRLDLARGLEAHYARSAVHVAEAVLSAHQINKLPPLCFCQRAKSSVVQFGERLLAERAVPGRKHLPWTE